MAEQGLWEKQEIVSPDTGITGFLYKLLSHDLRSPFSSMVGVLQLLLEDYDRMGNEERREFMSDLLESAKAQLRLFDNLMYLSRQERQTLKIQKSLIKADSFFQETLQPFYEKCQDKETSLVLAFDEGIYLNSDPDLLRLILVNLLDNALKYVVPGKGRINVSFGALGKGFEESGPRLRISDNGVGMPEGWSPSSTPGSVVSPGTRGETGVGLGLYMCYKLCSDLGITVSHEKPESGGTAVSLFFPKNGQAFKSVP